jgi:hypothetical protein
MGCGGRRLHPSHPQPCTEVLNPARSPGVGGVRAANRLFPSGAAWPDLPFCLDGDALGTEWQQN